MGWMSVAAHHQPAPGLDGGLESRQVATLWRTIAVPEDAVAGLQRDQTVTFGVPANRSPGYAGTVARIAHALDLKTRTMAVEGDREP